MIRVLICDSCCAATEIGEYIESELPVKTEEVIVQPGDDSIKERVEEAIAKNIAEVDIVVISNPLIAANTGKCLVQKYPAKKFIFYGSNLPEIVKSSKSVMLLTPKRLRTTKYHQMMKAECQEQEIEELDYDRWMNIASCNPFKITDEVKNEMNKFKGRTIILCSSESLWAKDRLENIISWRAEIVDLKQGIINELKEHFNMKPCAGRMRYKSELK